MCKSIIILYNTPASEWEIENKPAVSGCEIFIFPYFDPICLHLLLPVINMLVLYFLLTYFFFFIYTF